MLLDLRLGHLIRFSLVQKAQNIDGTGVSHAHGTLFAMTQICPFMSFLPASLNAFAGLPSQLDIKSDPKN